MNEGQSLEDKPRSGRRKKVTQRMTNRVVRTMIFSPFKGSKQIKHEVNQGIDERERISDQIVRRIGQKHSLYSRSAAYKFPLTPQQMKARLEFAETYRNKDMRY